MTEIACLYLELRAGFPSVYKCYNVSELGTHCSCVHFPVCKRVLYTCHHGGGEAKNPEGEKNQTKQKNHLTSRIRWKKTKQEELEKRERRKRTEKGYQ